MNSEAMSSKLGDHEARSVFSSKARLGVRRKKTTYTSSPRSSNNIVKGGSEKVGTRNETRLEERSKKVGGHLLSLTLLLCPSVHLEHLTQNPKPKTESMITSIDREREQEEQRTLSPNKNCGNNSRMRI